jgi:hypothetical protein
MRYSDALAVDASLGSFANYRGQGFAGMTGTMAAALSANSTVLALRYPLAATGLGLLKWMHLHFTCIGAFTTAVTAGRRLALKRGSGGDPSGGADLDITRDQAAGTELLWAGKVATTGALTMTNVAYETAARARLMLSQCGAAGSDYDEIWTFDDPFFAAPGELFGIVAPATFDAGGTWQLSVKGGCVEVQR